jgi:predicted RNA-binding Zn-ribbon protein involved in translation (DUF1610 family)
MKIEYTKEKLEEIVSKCTTYRQILLAFNRNESAGSYRVLQKKMNEWDININHFLTSSERAKIMFENGQLFKRCTTDIFTVNSNVSRTTVKKRVIDEKLIEYKCVKCGNKGEWLGEPITLILDHINGINNDNRLENLKFVCPNCNAQLETHCQGSKVFKIKEPKLDKRTLKHDRVETRKIEWPTKEVLMSLLKTMSYVSIGKTYGVSDNAVRKWSKKYEII